MKYSEIKTLDESWLDDEIRKIDQKGANSRIEEAKDFARMDALKEVKSQLKSATPILQTAFLNGRLCGENSIKDSYDNFEQFLNTEIK